MPREAPYLAVADVLRARILAGEWEIGERLPSRARLAVEYGVGRNVMQRAVDRLIIDGLLEGRAGSGTYVRMPRERLRLVRSRHHERREGSRPWPDRKERGRADAWDSHSQVRVPAPEAIAERLAISPGNLCVNTHYEFLADGQPVQLSESWEPMAITDGTPIVLPEMGPLAGREWLSECARSAWSSRPWSKCHALLVPPGCRRTSWGSAWETSCCRSSGPSSTRTDVRWKRPTWSFRTRAAKWSTNSESTARSR